MKRYKIVLLASVMSLLVSACSQEKKEEQLDMSCRISGVVAPEWVCTQNDLVDDTFSAVGASDSKQGMSFQRKEALSNGRVALAQLIKTEANSLSKAELNKINLINSKAVDMWIQPKTKVLYLLVSMPKPKLLK